MENIQETPMVDTPVEEYEIPQITPIFRRCDKISMSVLSTFSVLLGEALPKIGDVVTHWETPMVGKAEETGLEILPDNTQALKITKIKNIEPMTTGGLS